MMRRLTKVSALAALAALVLAGCQTVKQPTTQTTPAGPSATPVAETGPWLYARELRPSPGV